MSRRSAASVAVAVGAISTLITYAGCRYQLRVVIDLYDFARHPLDSLEFLFVTSFVGLLVGAISYDLLRTRADEKTCRKCGYLLHGLPIARCPECGEPFERACEDESTDKNEGRDDVEKRCSGDRER